MIFNRSVKTRFTQLLNKNTNHTNENCTCMNCKCCQSSQCLKTTFKTLSLIAFLCISANPNEISAQPSHRSYTQAFFSTVKSLFCLSNHAHGHSHLDQAEHHHGHGHGHSHLDQAEHYHGHGHGHSHLDQAEHHHGHGHGHSHLDQAEHHHGHGHGHEHSHFHSHTGII